MWDLGPEQSQLMTPECQLMTPEHVRMEEETHPEKQEELFSSWPEPDPEDSRGGSSLTPQSQKSPGPTPSGTHRVLPVRD